MTGVDDSGRRAVGLDIVIVNWNSGDLLRGCIAALASSTLSARLNVIVVDNASSDGSCDCDAGSLRLEIIRNRSNVGFAAACNQGAARGRAPFLLFLNPDTRVAPETLADALAFMLEPEQNETGVLGVRLVDEDGSTQQTCAREPTFPRLLAQNAGLDRLFPNWVLPHFMTDWDHAETRQVDQVMGAFLLIRRSLFDQVEGFDERYFVYYEDVDLCSSVRRTGARVVHFAAAAAWHQGGGTTSQVKDRRLFYMMRSQVLYARKWFGRGAALMTLFAALGLHVPIRAGQALLSFNGREAVEALKGGWLLVRDLPSLVSALGGPRPSRPVLQRSVERDRSPSL